MACFVVLLLLLLTPAFLVLAIHLWDRYVPRSDLQCRGCGYPVRGLERPTCPECGQELTPETTHRPEPPWASYVGLLIVLGIFGLTSGLIALLAYIYLD